MVKVFGLKKALAGGLLLTARMGLAIATAQIGLSLGVITPADNAGIVAAAIITSLISPLAYKLFSQEKDIYHHVYLLGGSKASLLLAERIKMHGLSCLPILQNKEIIPEFERKDIDFRQVEKLDHTVFDKIKLRPLDQVVVLTESKSLNVKLANYVKNQLNHSRLIIRNQAGAGALAINDEDVKLIDINELLAGHVEDLIVRPDSVNSLSESFGMYRVEEIRVSRQALHRKLVKEVAFPPSGSLVMQRRGSEIFIPHGDTRLLKGDTMTVIGNSSALANFREILE